MIFERALRLAIADGRDKPGSNDLAEARAELAGEEAEIDLIAEEDRPGNGFPAMGAGSQAPRLEPEDEGTLAEQEVEEGVAEADLDTRVKSRHKG
jgi:hypothetical protein